MFWYRLCHFLCFMSCYTFEGSNLEQWLFLCYKQNSCCKKYNVGSKIWWNPVHFHTYSNIISMFNVLLSYWCYIKDRTFNIVLVLHFLVMNTAAALRWFYCMLFIWKPVYKWVVNPGTFSTSRCVFEMEDITVLLSQCR